MTRGPLGALPALSGAARSALGLLAALAVVHAALLVAQAFLLASALADIVTAKKVPSGDELAVLLGVVLGRALTGWATRVVAARAAAGAKEELRAKAVDHALRLGPERIARHGVGRLTALTTRGLDALDGYFTSYLPALVTAAVVPVAAGGAVLFADWPSAVIIALTLPLLPMFAILVGKFTAAKVASATDATHRLSGHLLELIRALPVLAAFRRAEAQATAVRRVSDRHRKATVDTLKVAFSSAFVLELAATLSVALIAVVIGLRLVSGDLSLAIGLGVLILAPECFQPIRSVGTAFHAAQDGVEAVRRVADLLDEPAPSPGDSPPRRGEIRVDGLRVSRRGGDAPDGETFVLRQGETVWLRSPSGAGKSTTLAVLLGFVQPTGGAVTVDGVPLADLDPLAWRRGLAWVPQAPAFAANTVRAELELALADRDATPEPEELREVLAELGIADLLDRRVHRLSAGQRQRIAVARALLRVRHGAWLLLLDEPTAHLDTASAATVHAAIRRASAHCAVLIASHAGAIRDVAPNGDAPNISMTESFEVEDPARPNGGIIRLYTRKLVMGALLGAAALGAGVALTATSGWLIAKASQQPPILTLSVAVVGVRTFGLARAGLRYVERIITHDAAFRAATGLRVRLWQALARLGPARTQSLRRGEGQRRLVDDVDTIRDLMPRVLTPPLIAAAVAVVAIAVQTAVLPWAGLVLAVAVLAGGVLAPAVTLLAERRATAALAEGRRTLAAGVLALLDNAAELLAFGGYRTRRTELSEMDKQLAARARRTASGDGAGEALITLAMGSAAVLGTALAATAAARGHLDPVLAPLLALVPLALAEALLPLPQAAQHYDTLRRADARRREVEELRPLATPAHRLEQGPEGLRLTGDLGWPGGEPVLRGVDVRIPAGAYVAVTGPSGAGKSTLLAGLLGFLDNAEPAWRAALAPQEPQLVSTTVAENLRLADPHATDEQLTDVLDLACLPSLGLDTVLDDAGGGLSGGQAQRLALARALLSTKSADLVLLDEPTAHLDRVTARRIRQRLRSTLAGHTVVHVTHHAEELADADLVLEVRDGTVRESAVVPALTTA